MTHVRRNGTMFKLVPCLFRPANSLITLSSSCDVEFQSYDTKTRRLRRPTEQARALPLWPPTNAGLGATLNAVCRSLTYLKLSTVDDALARDRGEEHALDDVGDPTGSFKSLGNGC